MISFQARKEKQQRNKRKKVLKKVDIQRLVDDFPMFVNRQELSKYLARYELFKKILDVKGSIVECGVHRGASLMLFAKLSAIYEPYNFTREIIGFDTFEGFPTVTKKDSRNVSKGELADTDMEVLKECIKLFDENRPLDHVRKVKLVKGDASLTIPKFFKDNPQQVVALLYLDFDLYSPTKTALETILPRMPKGAIIAFDELNQHRWKGETIAALECLDINKIAIKKSLDEPVISWAVL